MSEMSRQRYELPEGGYTRKQPLSPNESPPQLPALPEAQPPLFLPGQAIRNITHDKLDNELDDYWKQLLNKHYNLGNIRNLWLDAIEIDHVEGVERLLRDAHRFTKEFLDNYDGIEKSLLQRDLEFAMIKHSCNEKCTSPLETCVIQSTEKEIKGWADDILRWHAEYVNWSTDMRKSGEILMKEGEQKAVVLHHILASFWCKKKKSLDRLSMSLWIDDTRRKDMDSEGRNDDAKQVVQESKTIDSILREELRMLERTADQRKTQLKFTHKYKHCNGKCQVEKLEEQHREVAKKLETNIFKILGDVLEVRSGFLDRGL